MIVLSVIVLGLFMKCGASPTSCQDSSEEEWFTSWNEFHDSSLLKLKPCDSFKSMCAHSLQVICESKWRLNVSSHSVNGWRDAPVLSLENNTYSYAIDIGPDDFMEIIGEGKFTIEHKYRYGCEEAGSGNEVYPSTLCQSNSTAWQSTRIITALIPKIQLEISPGSVVTEGETVHFLCSTNLASSHKILMQFQHNGQLGSCRTFQESPEKDNGWTIYRDDSESQHCVLEIENISHSRSGVYTCTGFLPDGTQLHSSVDINVQESSDTVAIGLLVPLIMVSSLLAICILILAVTGAVLYAKMKSTARWNVTGIVAAQNPIVFQNRTLAEQSLSESHGGRTMLPKIYPNGDDIQVSNTSNARDGERVNLRAISASGEIRDSQPVNIAFHQHEINPAIEQGPQLQVQAYTASHDVADSRPGQEAADMTIMNQHTESDGEEDNLTVNGTCRDTNETGM